MKIGCLCGEMKIIMVTGGNVLILYSFIFCDVWDLHKKEAKMENTVQSRW